jgi:hypothetical protein
VRTRGQLAAAAGALLAACTPQVHGNGVFEEDTLSVGAFDEIAIDDGIEATVEVGGPATQSVRVSGDSNVLAYVAADVSQAGVLTVRCSLAGGYDPTIPLRLLVQVPALVAFHAAGGSHAEIGGAAAQTFLVDAGGRGEVHLAGAGGDTLSVAANGESHLDAMAYPVGAASVDLANGSAVELVLTGGAVTGDARAGSTVGVYGGSCAVQLHDTSSCTQADNP